MGQAASRGSDYGSKLQMLIRDATAPKGTGAREVGQQKSSNGLTRPRRGTLASHPVYRPDMVEYVAELLFETLDGPTQRSIVLLNKACARRFRYRVKCVTVDELQALPRFPNLRELTLDRKGLWHQAVDLGALHRRSLLSRLRLLSGCHVDTVHTLLTFTCLKELELQGEGKLSDLRPLRRLTALTRLCLHTRGGSAENATDLGTLSRLTQLHTLALHGFHLLHLNTVGRLTTIASLCLDRCNVSDSNAAVLGQLTALEDLSLCSTWVQSLSFLQPLTALTRLYLNKTPVCDIAPIAQLRNIVLLGLAAAPLSPSALALDPLHTLTKLREIDLSHHSHTTHAIARLSATLKDVRTIHLTGSRMPHLLALARMTRLTELRVSSSCDLADLDGVGRLTMLRVLCLASTPVSSLGALKALPQLLVLDISRTQVGDLAPLSGLTTLQDLDAGDACQVSTIAPLTPLASLTRLVIRGTRVDSLWPVSGTWRLSVLDASHTAVRDLRPLSLLCSLANLGIAGVPAPDLAPLAGLTRMTRLDVSCDGGDSPPPPGSPRAVPGGGGGAAASATAPMAIKLGSHHRGRGSSPPESPRDRPCGGGGGAAAATAPVTLDLHHLAGMRWLQQLTLRGARVRYVESLAALTGLVTLDLSGSNIAYVSPLKGLSRLRWLDVTNKLLEGEDCECLGACPRLQHLAVRRDTPTVEMRQQRDRILPLGGGMGGFCSTLARQTSINVKNKQ